MAMKWVMVGLLVWCGWFCQGAVASATGTAEVEMTAVSTMPHKASAGTGRFKTNIRVKLQPGAPTGNYVLRVVLPSSYAPYGYRENVAWSAPLATGGKYKYTQNDRALGGTVYEITFTNIGAGYETSFPFEFGVLGLASAVMVGEGDSIPVRAILYQGSSEVAAHTLPVTLEVVDPVPTAKTDDRVVSSLYGAFMADGQRITPTLMYAFDGRLAFYEQAASRIRVEVDLPTGATFDPEQQGADFAGRVTFPNREWVRTLNRLSWEGVYNTTSVFVPGLVVSYPSLVVGDVQPGLSVRFILTLHDGRVVEVSTRTESKSVEFYPDSLLSGVSATRARFNDSLDDKKTSKHVSVGASNYTFVPFLNHTVGGETVSRDGRFRVSRLFPVTGTTRLTITFRDGSTRDYEAGELTPLFRPAPTGGLPLSPDVVSWEIEVGAFTTLMSRKPNFYVEAVDPGSLFYDDVDGARNKTSIPVWSSVETPETIRPVKVSGEFPVELVPYARSYRAYLNEEPGFSFYRMNVATTITWSLSTTYERDYQSSRRLLVRLPQGFVLDGMTSDGVIPDASLYFSPENSPTVRASALSYRVMPEAYGTPDTFILVEAPDRRPGVVHVSGNGSASFVMRVVPTATSRLSGNRIEVFSADTLFDAPFMKSPSTAFAYNTFVDDVYGLNTFNPGSRIVWNATPTRSVIPANEFAIDQSVSDASGSFRDRMVAEGSFVTLETTLANYLPLAQNKVDVYIPLARPGDRMVASGASRGSDASLTMAGRATVPTTLFDVLYSVSPPTGVSSVDLANATLTASSVESRPNGFADVTGVRLRLRSGSTMHPGTTFWVKLPARLSAPYDGAVAVQTAGATLDGSSWLETNLSRVGRTSFVDIPVEKQWVGGTGAPVTLTLLRDGRVAEMATVGEASAWRHTYRNQPTHTFGRAHVYAVTEPSVPDGFTSTVTGDATGFTVTNEKALDRTVDVRQVTVGDDPETEVTLLADGAPVDTVTLTEAGGWAHAFTGLPTETSGRPIAYTLTATDPTDAFDVKVSGDMDAGFVVTTTRNVTVSLERLRLDAYNPSNPNASAYGSLTRRRYGYTVSIETGGRPVGEALRATRVALDVRDADGRVVGTDVSTLGSLLDDPVREASIPHPTDETPGERVYMATLRLMDDPDGVSLATPSMLSVSVPTLATGDLSVPMLHGEVLVGRTDTFRGMTLQGAPAVTTSVLPGGNGFRHTGVIARTVWADGSVDDHTETVTALLSETEALAAGYGFAVEMTTTQTFSHAEDVTWFGFHRSPSVVTVSDSLIETGSPHGVSSGGFTQIRFDESVVVTGDTAVSRSVLPAVSVEPVTGRLVASGGRDGGRKLYTPLFPDESVMAGAHVVSPHSGHVGVTGVALVAYDEATLGRHMYHHVDSSTGERDVLLMRPANPGEDPFAGYAP